MIQKILRLLILGSLLMISCFGCRSITPSVSYYTMSPLTTESRIIGGGEDNPVPMIGIRSIVLPGTVDRIQMVRRTGSHQVKMESFHRWADYPDRMVQQLLRKNLQTLLPHTRVINAPWEVGLKPDITLSFQFLELIGSTDKTMMLSVVWTLADGTEVSRILSHRTDLTEPINGSGLDDLAEAHSLILGKLCREVATTIRSLEGSQIEAF